MNTKERHVRENNARENNIAESMPAHGKKQKNNGVAKSNRLWLWLGVLILIFILVYWLFVIGTGEDLMGVFNG
ncbi:MAG: hypothetical protein K2M93_03070 [Muribaculaceae bacterium]|nr:hypothetical protein [Muribaculaceae bacterium]